MPHRFDRAILGVISRAANPRAPRAPWRRSTNISSAATKSWSLLFTPPFDKPRTTPAISRAIRPASARTAANTRMARSGPRLPFAMQGDGDKAGELLSMLNPIRHADTPTGVHRYKVEPYVVCADVYSMPPHVGRGGWTWYTGSAGWMYRVMLEWLLGFRVQGENLALDPCIPANWPGFEIVFRYRSARYEIASKIRSACAAAFWRRKLDGEMLTGNKKLLIPWQTTAPRIVVHVVLG
jgi:cyclic beta-1,2-glucan synthetase